ncbi:unnamed protein product [Amoebophrya sp. A25]|nr:unnamed protein product [Amoebophrya sp. A25]|eukprot:GSA25T00014530001.1
MPRRMCRSGAPCAGLRRELPSTKATKNLIFFGQRIVVLKEGRALSQRRRWWGSFSTPSSLVTLKHGVSSAIPSTTATGI